VDPAGVVRARILEGSKAVTHIQLLLVSGIPTLAVLISFLLNNAGFGAIDRQLTIIESDLRHSRDRNFRKEGSKHP
jgi:hypothetical protein